MVKAAGPELEAAIERAGRIAWEILAPNAERIDRENVFPRESVQALRDSGLLGLVVPRDYGGLGGDARAYCQVVFELGRACPSTTGIFVMHSNVTRNIVVYAGESTKRRFLPQIAAGQALLSSSRNEPGGSTTRGYLGELRESLTPRPDGSYLFNTTKFFVTGSTGCDYFSGPTDG